MIQINIDENKVDNFSDDAQAALKKEVAKYASDLIKKQIW